MKKMVILLVCMFISVSLFADYNKIIEALQMLDKEVPQDYYNISEPGDNTTYMNYETFLVGRDFFMLTVRNVDKEHVIMSSYGTVYRTRKEATEWTDRWYEALKNLGWDELTPDIITRNGFMCIGDIARWNTVYTGALVFYRE